MAYLAFDTSNYTSSVSLAENGKILSDKRILLTVKKDTVGLRQSEALYQHWENMPKLIAETFDYINQNSISVEGIVVSSRPRPLEGSYMPVFNAGVCIAKILGASLNVPVIFRSHQEGHILSAAYSNQVDFSKPLVCAHLSGGTLELVTIDCGMIKIIGGTKDISYGQLIDRLGVALGFDFPAGKYIDKLAMSFDHENFKVDFKPIFTQGCELNISGLETQLKKALDNNELSIEELSYCIMKLISDSFIKIISNTGIKQVLVSGGVASSSFLRKYCEKEGYIFGLPELCSDNACGLALSEGKLPWLNQ